MAASIRVIYTDALAKKWTEDRDPVTNDTQGRNKAVLAAMDAIEYRISHSIKARPAPNNDFLVTLADGVTKIAITQDLLDKYNNGSLTEALKQLVEWIQRGQPQT